MTDAPELAKGGLADTSRPLVVCRRETAAMEPTWYRRCVRSPILGYSTDRCVIAVPSVSAAEG